MALSISPFLTENKIIQNFGKCNKAKRTRLIRFIRMVIESYLCVKFSKSFDITVMLTSFHL